MKSALKNHSKKSAGPRSDAIDSPTTGWTLTDTDGFVPAKKGFNQQNGTAMLSNNHGIGQEPKALNKETRGFHAASVQHWGFWLFKPVYPYS